MWWGKLRLQGYLELIEKLYITDTSMKNTKFQRLVNYLRALPPGQTITRKDLIDRFEDLSKTHDNGYGVDIYKTYLFKAGFIKEVTWGFYKIEKPIPEDLTLTRLRALAYGHVFTKLKSKNMQEVLLRFNAEYKNWKLFYSNGEVLEAMSISIIGCQCDTFSRMEDGHQKFYIKVKYSVQEWTKEKTVTLMP
jgi:hypothetical protein